MTVMIGIDPHKRTHTAVAIGDRDRTLDQLRVVADRRQIPKLLAWAEQFDDDRRWAVEGAGGLGRLVGVGLVSAGEQVVDVPAVLSARVRALGGTRTRPMSTTPARPLWQAGTTRTCSWSAWMTQPWRSGCC